MRRVASTLTSAALAVGLLISSGSAASANVIAGNGYSSAYSGESAFLGLNAGQTGQFSAIFFNDGNQPWLPGTIGLLVCLPDKVTCNVPSPNAAYAQNWYSKTVYATVSSLVPPGSNGFFSYNIKVPDTTTPSTTATFNGDVGIIGVGAVLRPQGYFHQNITPLPTKPLSITPASAAIGVGQSLQFTSSIPALWTVNGGCGAITQTGLFAATATNSPTQPCSVTATSAGASVQASVSVFGPAAALGCSADRMSLPADGVSTTIAHATIKDANGNAVVNAATPAITFTNVTPALVTMFPLGPQYPTAGVASVNLTATQAPGPAQITANATGLTGCNLIVTTGLGGTPVRTTATFLTDPVAADPTSTSVLQIDLLDALGNRAVNDNFTQVIVTRLPTSLGICSIGGVGSVAGSVALGRVVFLVNATSQPGKCVFSVSTDNTAIQGTQATLTTQLVGAASKLAVTASDSPKPAGSTAGITLTVDVQDAQGRRVTSSSAPITIQLDTASCAGNVAGNVYVPGGSVVSALQGRALFQLNSFGAYPGCVVTLNSTGLQGTNTTVRFDPAGADHLSCAFTPTAVLADGIMTSQAQVSVRDARGNLVTAGGPYTVTFSRATGVATQLLTTPTLTTTNGVATFTVRAATPGQYGIDSYNGVIPVGSQPTLPTPTTLSSCSISVQATVP